MTNQYWLVKQEPDSYAWTTFVADKKTSWEGVRNFQARNNLRAMKVGDAVLFYASVTTKAVLGTAEVSKAAYADPSADEGEWYAVELRAKETLAHPVSLDRIKADPALKNMVLVKNSRLSVQPVTKAEFTRILQLGKSGE
jgi:predicted RNA-binding protein with PUA-like domain